MNDLPLVSISCITFNHARYLRECFDGFLMQQTNFAFEVVIHDDASTDETKAIIEEYTQKHPTIFYPMYQKENQYSKGVRGIMAKFNFPRCRGKYITLCEGDDYWTDPNKLQKQVDFLEANEDYSICWTKYSVKKDSEDLEQPDWINQVEKNKDLSFDLNTIFTPYCTYTLTTMFRVESFDFEMFENLKYSKDNTIYAIALTKGKGMLLDFYSAVYRMHEGGVYSSASEYRQRYFSYLNLNEIVEKIPGCDTPNLRNVRDVLLRLSFRTHPSQKSKDYLMLILEGFKTLGIRETLVLIKKKYKGESI